MSTAPTIDAEVPAYLRALGLPGLADIHIHFMPQPVLAKVWDYFDAAETHYGLAWPITYRTSEEQRLATLRELGVRAVPALSYAHKPGMAAWLNDWCADFADRVPEALHCATLYPEDGVTGYVADALAAGARLWKVHVTVGDFAPDDPRLDDAWRLIDEAGTPVVLHAGSGPVPGTHSGPEAVSRLLRRHPRLPLVIAHLGMPEYAAFLDLAERHERVHLDTTMVGTDFIAQLDPLPEDAVRRMGELADRIVLGSDFPNIPYPYAHQLEALHRLDLGEDWLRRVLWHNGARLMGLPGD